MKRVLSAPHERHQTLAQQTSVTANKGETEWDGNARACDRGPSRRAQDLRKLMAEDEITKGEKEKILRWLADGSRIQEQKSFWRFFSCSSRRVPAHANSLRLRRRSFPPQTAILQGLPQCSVLLRCDLCSESPFSSGRNCLVSPAPFVRSLLPPRLVPLSRSLADRTPTTSAPPLASLSAPQRRSLSDCAPLSYTSG